jgi:hypothetical protein
MNFNTYNKSELITHILIFIVIVALLYYIYQLYNHNTKTAKTNYINNDKYEKMKDLPEDNTNKLIIYHMKNCGACKPIMKDIHSNNKTMYDILKSDLSQHNVQVLDFQYGRDTEANKFNSFPTIVMVNNTGGKEYGKMPTLDGLKKFALDNKT